MDTNSFEIELLIYFLAAVIYVASPKVRCIVKNFADFLNNLDYKYFIAVCLGVILLFSQIVILDGHNWGGDFSQYIAQSRAILTGEMQSWLDKQSFIFQNSVPGMCPLIVSWGTPLIILPLYKIFGMNFYVFKCLMAVFLAGAWIVLYNFLRLKFNKAISVILTSVLLFNLYYLQYVDNVLTEMPFLFFSVTTIFFIYKRNLSDKKSIQYGIFIGILLFCTAQIRSIGLALLIALVADDLISLIIKLKQKIFMRNQIISVFANYALPYIIFFILQKILASNLPYINVENNSGYLVTFSFQPHDIFQQILSYTAILGSFFFPNINVGWTWADVIWLEQLRDNLPFMILSALFLCTIIVGMIKNFSADRCIIFYFGITMAVLYSFNTFAGIRYVFGIIPFALYFSFQGINYIAEKFGKGNLCGGIFFSVAVVSLLFNLKYFAHPNPPNVYQAYSKEATATYEFINENISDDNVIFFFKPRVLYLNTNVYAYFNVGGEEVFNLANYVSFTVEDDLDDLKKIVETSPKYQLEYVNEKFALYKILRD